MRRSLTFMKELTNEELGVEIDEIQPTIEIRNTDSPSSVKSATKVKVKKPKPSPFEAFQVSTFVDPCR